MTGKSGGSNVASVSSSRPDIPPGSLPCSKNMSLELQFNFREQKKNHRGRGLLKREGGMTVVFAAARRVTCGRARCHGAGTVAPFDRMLTPDVFLQLPQSIVVETSIHPVTWLNKFLMHNTFSVTKNKSTLM
jgi:hypothetical protein